jgi:hypothetical protein
MEGGRSTYELFAPRKKPVGFRGVKPPVALSLR